MRVRPSTPDTCTLHRYASAHRAGKSTSHRGRTALRLARRDSEPHDADRERRERHEDAMRRHSVIVSRSKRPLQPWCSIAIGSVASSTAHIVLSGSDHGRRATAYVSRSPSTPTKNIPAKAVTTSVRRLRVATSKAISITGGALSGVPMVNACVRGVPGNRKPANWTSRCVRTARTAPTTLIAT